MQFTWMTGLPPAPWSVQGRGQWARFLLRSHFFHDVHFRYSLWRFPPVVYMTPFAEMDLTITRAILGELKREVERRGAELVVGLIPSAVEIDELNDWPPYQDRIAPLCEELGIDAVDLSPAHRRSWLRTYFRTGGHWNARGHAVAAGALVQRLGR